MAPLKTVPRAVSASGVPAQSAYDYDIPTVEQTKHKVLAIPGPIEVTDEVLDALSRPPLSHVSPRFAKVFQECLKMTRQVLCTKDAQPFIVGGSGTLGWDQVAANLIEPGENVLVLQTGYFGQGFADCMRTYQANVDTLEAPTVGARVPLSQVEAALSKKRYKAITITHVDTSTGVLSDARAIAQLVRRVSPNTLVVLDGVCSVASEEIRMDGWDLDVIVTASQKGLGAPPGLSIVVASQRALRVFETRRSPVTSYYASWKKWIPIMNAYDNGQPAYFGTPPVNLIFAYHASLEQITREGLAGLDARFRAHRIASRRIKALADQLGMRQVAIEEGGRANGMTAIYMPEGVTTGDVLARMNAKGFVVAGGLIAGYKDKYIRIGHMGTSVVDNNVRKDIDRIAVALRETIGECIAERDRAVMQTVN